MHYSQCLGIQSKITIHTKTQENMIHSQVKKKKKKLSTETGPKMIQILDLVDKDFKGAIINISKR